MDSSTGSPQVPITEIVINLDQFAKEQQHSKGKGMMYHSNHTVTDNHNNDEVISSKKESISSSNVNDYQNQNHNNSISSIVMSPPILVPTSSTTTTNTQTTTPQEITVSSEHNRTNKNHNSSKTTTDTTNTTTNMMIMDHDTAIIDLFMESFGVVADSNNTTTLHDVTTTDTSSTAAATITNHHHQHTMTTIDTGRYMCVRHTTCPVIVGMYRTDHTNKKHHHHPTDTTTSLSSSPPMVPFQVMSCRMCYVDEKTMGGGGGGMVASSSSSTTVTSTDHDDPTPKTMYQIVRIIHDYMKQEHGTIPTTTTDTSSTDLNYTIMSSIYDDFNVSDVFNTTSMNLSHHNSNKNNNSSNDPTTTVPTVHVESSEPQQQHHQNDISLPLSSSSLAVRILHAIRSSQIDPNTNSMTYNHHQTNIMESCLKRMQQVQYWTTQRYMIRIVQYQQMITTIRTQYEQQIQVYQSQIQQLKRTIQQDCKVIKTMATQQQDVEQALGLSNHQSTTNNTNTTTSNINNMNNNSNSSLTMMNHNYSPPKHVSPNPKISRTRSSMSQSIHQHASIPEFGEDQNDDTETSTAIHDETIVVQVPSVVAHDDNNNNNNSNANNNTTIETTQLGLNESSMDQHVVPTRNTSLLLQQRWNRRGSFGNTNGSSLLSSSQHIFQSFRGGLLDIPSSPPAHIRHDHNSIHDDNNDIDTDNNNMFQHLQQHHNKVKKNKKLTLNSAAFDALQIPSRGLLSRSNSVIMTTTPNTNTNNPNNMMLLMNPNSNNDLASLLTAKLAQEQDQSPCIDTTAAATAISNANEQHKQDMTTILPSVPFTSTHATISSPENSTTIANTINSMNNNNNNDYMPPIENLSIEPVTTVMNYNNLIPSSTVTSMSTNHHHQQQQPVDTSNDHTTDEDIDDDDDEITGTVTDGTSNNTKFLFSVTGAMSHDKFGDVGIYTGTILVTEGLPHGIGKMDYDSGRIYEGDWICGQWHGKGKLLNPNGDSYDGEFFFDARHGHGTYRWDNGDIYVGNFHNDKRHGRGKFSFHNGNVYEGEFCDGLFDGRGRYDFAGGIYEGDWKDGRYNGTGVLTYTNTGGKYTGEFRNSVAHGFGIETMPDGRQRRGVWVDGKPTEYFDDNKQQNDITNND